MSHHKGLSKTVKFSCFLIFSIYLFVLSMTISIVWSVIVHLKHFNGVLTTLGIPLSQVLRIFSSQVLKEELLSQLYSSSVFFLVFHSVQYPDILLNRCFFSDLSFPSEMNFFLQSSPHYNYFIIFVRYGLDHHVEFEYYILPQNSAQLPSLSYWYDKITKTFTMRKRIMVISQNNTKIVYINI